MQYPQCEVFVVVKLKEFRLCLWCHWANRSSHGHCSRAAAVQGYLVAAAVQGYLVPTFRYQCIPDSKIASLYWDSPQLLLKVLGLYHVGIKIHSSFQCGMIKFPKRLAISHQKTIHVNMCQLRKSHRTQESQKSGTSPSSDHRIKIRETEVLL